MRFERGKGALAVEVEAGSAAEEAQALAPDAGVAALCMAGSLEQRSWLT